MAGRRKAFRRCLPGLALCAALPLSVLVLPALARAQTQEQGTQPLSVIDWLGAQPPVQQSPDARPAAPIDEPATAKTATVPDVTVQPLGESGPRMIGLVPADVTGLPTDLWAGSDPERLTALIQGLPDLRLPAAQALLYTVLLAEAAPPGGKASDGDALALARVARLMAQGALDPAQSLIEQVGVTTSPAHFDLWMRISLLTGTEDRACDVLRASPHLTSDYGTRIFCDVRARRWDDAALTLNTAKALNLLPADKLLLLEHFLDPETVQDSGPLIPPLPMDPLSFRLFETIGEPLPSSSLPRAYAVADLRDLAGWKAQIEAAERLTRNGALPDNRLLGLYTERQAAASGGVWDRVVNLQRFDTALASGSAEAVAKTLPAAWQSMVDVELESSFASLFADRLAAIEVAPPASEIARKVQLLSPAYEAAAVRAGDSALSTRIALGEVPPNRPDDIIAAAIFDAFNDAPPRADLLAMVQQDRLGEAILQTLKLLHDGTRGNAKALTGALATLRALGLEDTARRSALQILLLDRS